MATARFDMRLDKRIKAKAEKATALLGLKSLTEYIVKIIDEDATRVITQYGEVSLENDIFDRFVIACEETKKPNAALKEAVAFTREQGIK